MSKYLIYDAYGTLLRVNASIEGLSKEESELSDKIQALWRSKQLQYTWLRSQMDRWVDFNQVTTQALDHAFEYYQVNNERLKKAILSIFDQPRAFDDATAFLDAAKQQSLSNAILSNGQPAKLVESVLVAGIEEAIDDIFSASQVKVFKPSPRVYQIVVDHYQCAPEDVRFFSSNAWDIAGAKAFGFVTIWINRQQAPFEELGVRPDFEFTSFADFEVRDIL